MIHEIKPFADLSEAELSGANLSGADLSGADMCEANMFGAKLSGANLFGANLSGANLSGADMFGADLREADLSRANLCEAKNIFIFNKTGGRTCYAVVHKNGLMIHAGCFWGTIEEFELADKGETYKNQIEYLKTLEKSLCTP